MIGKTAFCTGVNPGFAGGAYGYVAMGPYQGGQAQYLRVPFADFNGLKLPPGTEHEADFALLADIFPTGWHGLQLSGFQPGESVAVFGAGPVGLSKLHCSLEEDSRLTSRSGGILCCDSRCIECLRRRPGQGAS